MAVTEETIKRDIKEVSKSKTTPVINRILDFLSSVRFGVVLLCILVALSMLGMLIIQQNVQGFDAYYGSLTPAEKTVFGTLGFFDIYHSWYYNFLLLVLSLNLVLASIDHFPSSWSYIVEPKLTATREWLLKQKPNEVFSIRGENETEIAEKISRIFKANGLKTRISEGSHTFYVADETGKKDFSQVGKKSLLYVFGESGRINRLGAYIVHVFLLILFLGHFVALQTGFDADVPLVPGQTTNEIRLIQFNLDKQERYSVQLPFTVTCTDIQQKLIDPKGSVDITNTLDWRTQIKIDDPQYGATVADVSLNKPFSYRGYRFFQAQTIPTGNARNITLQLTPQKEGEPQQTIQIQRNGATQLPDGTRVQYEEFLPDFVMNGGKPDTRSADYNNPAAVLNVTKPNGEKERVFAFAAQLPDNAPIGAPKAGYKWRLADFEKSPLAHILSIKYDPFDAAFVAWYIGGIGLIFALGFVFFVSHKRVWALIEKKDENNFEVVLGGNTNRNHFGFEDKFKKIVGYLKSDE
ncbi:MAG TPA: cytochrome c biogenesis protein ResB [Pyrinomonadaceae bacterium]|nr:cytochrome c biogenesis protein ResB [Pyrinomonadaceae bacterium]